MTTPASQPLLILACICLPPPPPCSGCGNTVNANHPATQQQILDSLRWWVEEYHVDGFRFDLGEAFQLDKKLTQL